MRVANMSTCVDCADVTSNHQFCAEAAMHCVWYMAPKASTTNDPVPLAKQLPQRSQQPQPQVTAADAAGVYTLQVAVPQCGTPVRTWP